MATKVTMPEMGELITEGTLVRWFKTVGDQVEKDEPLFEVSTYKPAGSLQVGVEVDVMSPAAGVLLEIIVKECCASNDGEGRRQTNRKGAEGLAVAMRLPYPTGRLPPRVSAVFKLRACRHWPR